MLDNLITAPETAAYPLHLVAPDKLDAVRERLSAESNRWLDATGFQAKAGQLCILPQPDGQLQGALFCARADDPWCLGDLAARLPDACFKLVCDWNESQLIQALAGFQLGTYRFSRYKKVERPSARLMIPDAVRSGPIESLTAAICLVRDLINTPAENMLPGDLAEATRGLATEFGASFQTIVGDALLQSGYPAIHAVGRASAAAPRLIELLWGDPDAPKVSLVGKGVCFDSGGLDIKPPSSMRLMKKDMGGAANVLGLARMIMHDGLPIRLRVLIPAVENAISGNAMRPGDVIPTRRGLNIEIHNTDAEGRVILSDALADASDEKPRLLVDYATLTGAARVAVGPEIAAMFSNDDALAGYLHQAGERLADPCWRLPLHDGYEPMIDSSIADVLNATTQPHAGATTAALFLRRFVAEQVPWVHFDIMAWNTRNRPGRPEGGEAMGIRAVYDYIETQIAQR
ncbi:MAG: leucyl aminopeptidase family protein [Gammaproteobacteria bacterium]|nr:leucyl aminopeptidase family protein [Gammaproteobacteria bacterium]